MKTRDLIPLHTDIPNSSKFHCTVRNLLRADPAFRAMTIYQEVPVQRLAPHYQNAAHRFDFYIHELKVVIEVHGKQHYEFSNRGNIGHDLAHRNFLQQKQRDSAKKNAATMTGHAYLEIPYTIERKLDLITLRKLILKRAIE